MFFHMVYKSGQIFLPFCHNSRVWQTDRQTDGQTDGQTEFSSLDRVCIPCSAVKTGINSCLPLPVSSWCDRMIHVNSPVQSARLNSTQLSTVSFNSDPVFVWPHDVNTNTNIFYLITDVMYDMHPRMCCVISVFN